mmetsp:Transcript_37669/g.69619  ORF Transcript_37669/g.69619 Transcript_37669/m.69619 type:complete len:596 (-) Transcript_37669:82-1869(-)
MAQQCDPQPAGEDSCMQVDKEHSRPRRTGRFTQLQNERCPTLAASSPEPVVEAAKVETALLVEDLPPINQPKGLSGPSFKPLSKGEWNRRPGKGGALGKGSLGKNTIALPHRIGPTASGTSTSPSSTSESAAAQSTAPAAGAPPGSSAAAERRFKGGGRGFDAKMRQRHLQASKDEVLRQQEFKERLVFLANYETAFGLQHPPFLDGSFIDAVSSARNRGRLLLVWLRNSQSSPEVEKIFGNSIWPTPLMQDLVAKRYVLWQGDTERWLTSSQLRQVLGLPSTPALVVLQPQACDLSPSHDRLIGGGIFERPTPSVHVPGEGRALAGEPCEFPSGQRWRVFGHFDAPDPQALCEGEPVVQFLLEVTQREEAERRQADEQKWVSRIAEWQLLEETRLLREQQDREYQEALCVDQERERRRRTSSSGDSEAAEQPAHEPVPQASAAAAELRGQHSSEPAEPSRLSLRRRSTAERILADERLTAPTGGSCCRIVVRLPSGNRIERAFAADGPVSRIYEWVDCAAELLACERAADSGKPRTGWPLEFEVPENFILSLTFPRQPLRDREVTLKEAGLCPNAVLALMQIDGSLDDRNGPDL